MRWAHTCVAARGRLRRNVKRHRETTKEGRLLSNPGCQGFTEDVRVPFRCGARGIRGVCVHVHMCVMVRDTYMWCGMVRDGRRGMCGVWEALGVQGVWPVWRRQQHDVCVSACKH